MGKLVVLLIAANIIIYAWAKGMLAPLGIQAQSPKNTQTLERQIRPESLEITPIDPVTQITPQTQTPQGTQNQDNTEENTQLEEGTGEQEQQTQAAEEKTSAETSTTPQASAQQITYSCKQAGAYNEQQIEKIKQAAAKLPQGIWNIQTTQLPGRWMVYIGKLTDQIEVQEQKAAIRAKGIDTDKPGQAHEPGLSLGRYSTQEAAQRALKEVNRKGVNSAKVIQERRDTPAYIIKLPKITKAQEQQARQILKNSLAGKELDNC